MRFFRLNALPMLAAALCLGAVSSAQAQVTTGAMAGQVTGPSGPIVGARVAATHQPSGTVYQALTRADGRFTLPGMRVGGPYQVTAIALGFEKSTQNGLEVTLGATTDVSFALKNVPITLTGVQVTATGGALSSQVTGAATTISKEVFQSFPTIGRTITDFTRLTPQSSGSSFAGQDNRLNNFTLDGSAFNNSFGLGSQPGARTGVSPIPIDAIEQLLKDVAVYPDRPTLEGIFERKPGLMVTFGGEAVIPGNIIIRQRGTRVHAGANVGMGKDHTLFATAAGVVEFQKKANDRMYVTVQAKMAAE